MIFREFPDHRAPGFDLDAPCPRFGWPNMVIHACGADVHYPEHIGPLSIKCAFGGSERYVSEGSRYSVDDRGYLVLNDGQRYESHIPADRPTESFCVFFERSFAAALLASLVTPDDRLLEDPLPPPPHPLRFLDRVYPHDTIVSAHLLALRRELATGAVMPPELLEERFHHLLRGLIERHRLLRREIDSLPAVRASTRGEIYRRICRARDYIDASLGEVITLEHLAGVACLSPHHFLRRFSDVVGVTPHRYVTRRRLERASELLLATDMTVQEIAHSLCFESPTTFSGLFRRTYGISPSRWRTGQSSSSDALTEKDL